MSFLDPKKIEQLEDNFDKLLTEIEQNDEVSQLKKEVERMRSTLSVITALALEAQDTARTHFDPNGPNPHINLTHLLRTEET